MIRIQYIILGKKTRKVLHVETSEITNQVLSYYEYQDVVERAKEIGKKYLDSKWKIEISMI